MVAVTCGDLGSCAEAGITRCWALCDRPSGQGRFRPGRVLGTPVPTGSGSISKSLSGESLSFWRMDWDGRRGAAMGQFCLLEWLVDPEHGGGPKDRAHLVALVCGTG